MKNISRLILIIASLTLLLGLSACQTPEVEVKTPKREVVKRKSEKDIVPVLQQKTADQQSEFKLRSQTARYLNAEKSRMEVVLADTFAITCQKPTPELQADDNVLKFTLATEDGQAIKQDQSLGKGLKLEGTYNGAAIKSIANFSVTTLNDAVIRGNLQVTTDSSEFNGDYFSAICKQIE